jgi:hypothetical protein
LPGANTLAYYEHEFSKRKVFKHGHLFVVLDEDGRLSTFHVLPHLRDENWSSLVEGEEAASKEFQFGL